MTSATTTTKRRNSSLAPGFRFHPTDEELVRYYLKRRVTNKPTSKLLDPIASIDIYKFEPWDLPSQSKLETRDLEWYFFSCLDKKYGNGSRTNRATEKGYWKTTGKDRPVTYANRNVGMKKTLVYHLGRAPRGERSNWVMHEYRLTDEDLEKSGAPQDAYVLCRVFQKSGSGPKNGEQYGAPFIEEEWENDDEEMDLVPDEEKVVVEVANDVAVTVANELPFEDGLYFDAHDPDKNIPVGIPIPAPLDFYCGDSSNSFEQPAEYSEAEEKPITNTDDLEYGSKIPDDNLFFDIPEEFNLLESGVKNEFVSESSDNVNNPVDLSYLLDENYLDAAFDNNQYSEGLFLETNDLLNADQNSFDVGEYLTFFDAEDETLPQSMSSQLMNGESSIFEQASAVEEPFKEGGQVSMESQHVPYAHGAEEQKLEPESAKFVPDVKYPFLKQASHLLGNIPAPPAFASEFPSKSAIYKLNSEGQSSSSVHSTAGMVTLRNTSLTASGMEWTYGKNGNLNVTLSFNLSQDAMSATKTRAVSYEQSVTVGELGLGDLTGTYMKFDTLTYFAAKL
ncbi:hypothetical protein ACFE04_002434 [Oxalis oulophora]